MLFWAVDESDFEKISSATTSKRSVGHLKKRCSKEPIELSKCVYKLQDVYYVPDLKTNILSMRQLTEKGYSIFLKDRLLHLKNKQGRLVARIEMVRNWMYKLNLRSIREKCLHVNIEDKSSPWHLRFGHLHHGGCSCRLTLMTSSSSVCLY